MAGLAVRRFLSSFMFLRPTAAKRLYFQVIPHTVDDYLGLLEAYPRGHGRRDSAIRCRTFTPGPQEPEGLTHDEPGSNEFIRHADESRRGFQRRKSVQFCQGSSAATVPRRLPKRVPVWIAWFATRPLISRFSRPQEALRRSTSGAGVLVRVSSKLTQIPANVSADKLRCAL